MKILLENAAILTPVPGGITEIPKGYLGIEDQNICYVDSVPPADLESYDERRDMSGKLLLPGLINSHTHSPMTLLRGLGSELPLDRWLREAMWPVEEKLTAEMIQIGSRLAIMEMIAGGTTCFSDMYFMAEGIVEEVCRAGIKSNQTRAMVSFQPGETLSESSCYAEFKSLYENYHGYDNGRILIDYSIHAEYTMTESLARELAAECLENKANMHIHLSETLKENKECRARHGRTPAEWFRDIGVFNSRAQAAHCVVVDENDMEKGVTVIHNPSSNLKLGSGFAPIQTMIDKGINLSLGTDGAASNNNLNMFEEMHLAAMIHKGFHCNPTIVSPRNVLAMATLNGAAMTGRDNIGSLETGKRADIIAVDLDKPHLTPRLDLQALVVYSLQASDVVMTMADGKVIYENGEFLTIDADKARHDINAVLKQLY